MSTFADTRAGSLVQVNSGQIPDPDNSGDPTIDDDGNETLNMIDVTDTHTAVFNFNTHTYLIGGFGNNLSDTSEYNAYNANSAQKMHELLETANSEGSYDYYQCPWPFKYLYVAQSPAGQFVINIFSGQVVYAQWTNTNNDAEKAKNDPDDDEAEESTYTFRAPNLAKFLIIPIIV